MQCLMDHMVLNVKNDERMIDFYSKVMLFAPERLEEYRAGEAPFPSVRLNSDTIIDLFPIILETRKEISLKLGTMRATIVRRSVYLGHRQPKLVSYNCPDYIRISISFKALHLKACPMRSIAIN